MESVEPPASLFAALVADADLVPHARPRLLEVVDEIPRTAATGQNDRTRLLSMVAEQPT